MAGPFEEKEEGTEFQRDSLGETAHVLVYRLAHQPLALSIEDLVHFSTGETVVGQELGGLEDRQQGQEYKH